MSQTNKAVETRYTVKPVVAARLLAESTVLVILSLLPLSLFVVKELIAADWMIKLILALLSPISISALVAAGFLPFRLVLTAGGIKTVALLRSTYVEWAAVRTVKLVSKWGFRIYEIRGESGTLAFFPLWFKKIGEIVQYLRMKAPNRGRSVFSADHSYKRDFAVLVIQLLKVGAQLLFLTVFWFFFASYKSTTGNRSEDVLILLAAGIVFSGIVIWKLYLLITMPGEVCLTRDHLVLKGILGTKTVQRSDISRVGATNFLQPEGLVVRCGEKSVLVGAVFESFDELEEELVEIAAGSSKVPPQQSFEPGHNEQ
ncbi:MAG: hypothetical protein K2W95_35085 [Candidatus Obscuribacterales bacterium]|nr:hypothetical protein [Candidatus Obscuribacterales bacterium]